MDLMVLDQNFNAVYVLEKYESLVWVDKYQAPGTFELELPFYADAFNYVIPGNYLSNSDSSTIMIIEDISYETDTENGDKIKAIGRSLESILDRRIIWDLTTFKDEALQTAIKSLLDDAIVSPKVKDRQIPNFLAYVPITDSYLDSRKVQDQYQGDNLLEVIQNLCTEFKIGFKISINSDNQYVFTLYRGVNRSYSQSENPYIVFSNDFDNIISTIYTDRTSEMKNIAVVGGTGTGSSKTMKVVGVKKGLERRELFVDGDSLTDEDLTKAQYNAALEKKGLSELNNANRRTEYDANIDPRSYYTYGVDYNLGDIIQLGNKFGINVQARITEYTWSYTTNGIEKYPTFETIPDTAVTGKNKLATTLANLVSLNSSNWDFAGNVATRGGVVLTVNLDNEDRVVGITFRGKNTASSNYVFTLGQIVTDTTSLILSGCIDGSSSTYKIAQYDTTSSAERAINYDGDTEITTYNLSHTYHVRLTLYRNKDFNDVTLYPMVRDTSENSSFEPYIE